MKNLLEVGLTPEGDLLTVDEVSQGKTDLVCPFCKGILVAKKGHVKQHHFAHLEDSCAESASLKLLPGFDDFTLKLTPDELQAMNALWENTQDGKYGVSNPRLSLVNKGMLAESPFRPSGSHEFTKLGKIPVKGLSLNLFAKLHPQLLLSQHEELTAFYNQMNSDTDKVILEVYRAQLRRLYKTHLYLLEIEADNELFYKIGLTTRNIEDRQKEVLRDLHQHFNSIEVKVLAFKEYRGHCERYFKYRYSENNKPIGSLTEYFSFEPAQAKKVIADIKRMPKREFLVTEQRILSNWWAKEEKRLKAVRRGMSLAKAMGQTNLGRPQGSNESLGKYLDKPKNKKIAQLLNNGYSIRKVAKLAEASERTVQRVKKSLAML